MANLDETVDRIMLALTALQVEVTQLRGMAESCEYYMDLAERRGKQIDALRKGTHRDGGYSIPEQISTRCTYLMTQEDLDD